MNDQTGTSHKPSERATRGFTLMELMVVIAILGLLVTLVAPNVWNVFRQGNVRTAQAQIKGFEGAIGQYRSVHGGKIPDSLDVLVQPDPQNFNESYLSQEAIPLDPWGNPYEYKKLSSSKYEIISRGADGVPGGSDDDEDITNHDTKK